VLDYIRPKKTCYGRIKIILSGDHRLTDGNKVEWELRFAAAQER